jgi:hypothetical protein
MAGAASDGEYIGFDGARMRGPMGGQASGLVCALVQTRGCMVVCA